jgi:hypothetical protein
MNLKLSVKLRLLSLLGVLLMVLTAFAAPAASASVHGASLPHPVRLTYKSATQASDLSTNIFCQSDDTNECLNLQNCNTSAGIVQLYSWTTGYGCSEGFYADYQGTVDPSQVWPFFCGDGLNSTYAGDRVFFVTYSYVDVSTSYTDVPVSAGNNGTVTLANTGGPGYDGPEGLFVEQDNNTGDTAVDTRLIDVTATCNSGNVQHLYAGCSGNGCLVREGENPSANEYWDLMTQYYP